MDAEIIKLNPTDTNDFSYLIKVFEAVFEWENSYLLKREHLEKLLGNSKFLVFVAKIDKEIIGELTAHVLDRYDTEKSSVYIYDLAITTHYQRKGIGKRLIATLNDYCTKNGCNEVLVQAETDDFQAVNFYRTTPITSELKATHFTYSFDNN